MKASIQVAVQTEVPILLWGSPGTSKTAQSRQLFAGLGLPLETLIGSIIEPQDIGGLPMKDGNRTIYAEPSWCARLREAGKGGVFMDELTGCPPPVQNGLLRVVHEGAVGEHKLPPATYFIGAANPPNEAAGGWPLSPAMANRWCHIQWNLTPNDWVEWALHGNGSTHVVRIPDGWKKWIKVSMAKIAEYIRKNPTALFAMPENETKRSGAWPSPRSWTNAATLQAAIAATNQEYGLKLDDTELIAGCVGEGPAREYQAWLKAQDLPDPEEILANPGSFKIPDRDDRLYVILSTLAATANMDHPRKKERWMAAWVVMDAAAKASRTDIAVISASTLMKGKPAGVGYPKQALVFSSILNDIGL